MIHRIIWQLRPNRLNNFSCRISSKWCKANISSFSSCPGHLLIHIFNIFKVYFFDLIVFETCILSYLRCECNSSSCVSDTAFVISSLECLPKLKRNKNREIKEIFAPIFNQRANEFVQQIGYIQMSDENACFGGCQQNHTISIHVDLISQVPDILALANSTNPGILYKVIFRYWSVDMMMTDYGCIMDII